MNDSFRDKKSFILYFMHMYFEMDFWKYRFKKLFNLVKEMQGCEI